uniref:PilW family protein n=1 Tax=Acetatifactor sp. TaxID=1872090 RepID=UPI0040578E2E
MEEKRQIKNDNAGFSLVELLVAIAIFSIVSIAFFEFVMVALKHYQKETMEVEIQYEAQLAVNQLQDLMIDAKKGVSYTVNGMLSVRSDAEIPAGTTVNSKEVIVYNANRYYVVKWNAADRELVYSEYLREADATWTTVADEQLMAEYISDFSVDLSLYERNQSIGIDALFEKDREYRVTQNVKLRNQVSINAALADIYG